GTDARGIAERADALEERMHRAEPVAPKHLMKLLGVQRSRRARPAAQPVDSAVSTDDRLVREAAADPIEVVAEPFRKALRARQEQQPRSLESAGRYYVRVRASRLARAVGGTADGADHAAVRVGSEA